MLPLHTVAHSSTKNGGYPLNFGLSTLSHELSDSASHYTTLTLTAAWLVVGVGVLVGAGAGSGAGAGGSAAAGFRHSSAAAEMFCASCWFSVCQLAKRAFSRATASR